jgi:class 3 adenylate cyclase/tetratricopeptide (TPR) repeat protein
MRLGQLGPAAMYGTPQSYTPRHLAEKILTSKAALEGERKQVTVLFADLKGSMELLADRDPEEARKLLDPVLEHMMEAVHRYEGTVNQVMGDGIMALFGAPLAHEDHAVRACYAALRMQESVKHYAEGVFRTYGLPVQIRVGLNSGEVVVRAIGSDLHMDYSAIGQTTHLAARMEQMAAPGTILLALATLRLAEDYIQVAPNGPVPVKGLPDPVDIYVLTGAVARTRLQAGVARGLTAFVGRDAEIEQMRRALNLARDRHGQLVAVVGEPGVGKSRLFHEFIHSHRTEGWRILEAGSVSYGKASSYLPVINLLKTYCRIESQDEARTAQEKVTGKLLALGAESDATLSAFLALLDVPVEDAQWHALDPTQRRQRTLDACKHFLMQESQIQPLLLVFEDLHWIDSETEALLDSIIDSLPTARLLLLVNYRPEYQHGWGSKTFYTQVRVDPLPAGTADAFLDTLLGDDASLSPVKQLLMERTQGNPFFLEESVQSLVETKVLSGERGEYRLLTALPSIQLPATVQAVLASRIDRLPPEAKVLLQTAAVIGTDAPFALLLAVAEDNEQNVRRQLTTLHAAEFLYERHLFPEPAYAFKHALTHEVAYGGLLQGRRKVLHAKAVETIERLYGDRLAEQTDSLARHAVHGELWDKAFDYLMRAAGRSASKGAFPYARHRYEEALNLLPRLPTTPDLMRRAIDLRLDLAYTTYVLGEIPRFVELLREAEDSARQLGDQQRIGEVALRHSQYCWFDARYREGIRYAQQAIDVAAASGHRELHGSAMFRLAVHHLALGEHQTGIELCRGVVEEYGQLAKRVIGPASTFLASSCSFLSLALALTGDFPGALKYAELGVQAADTSSNPHSQATSYTFLGTAALYQGDVRAGLPWCERAVHLCESKQVIIWLPSALSTLGWALAKNARPQEGLPHLVQGAVLQERNRQKILLSAFYLRWAEGLLLLRDLTGAKHIAHRALDLSNTHEERGVEAWTLELLGEIAVAEGSAMFDNAHEFFRQASDLGAQLGMRPLVAHCHLGLGKLYQRTGEPKRAKEHVTAATTLYRDMGMTYWLEQAERHLAT